jgi:hypothetical protein
MAKKAELQIGKPELRNLDNQRRFDETAESWRRSGRRRRCQTARPGLHAASSRAYCRAWPAKRSDGKPKWLQSSAVEVSRCPIEGAQLDPHGMQRSSAE